MDPTDPDPDSDLDLQHCFSTIFGLLVFYIYVTPYGNALL
jgi:hypothetical protein